MNRNTRRGPGMATGPLVTNHIRNLDQELEMLQRRRDILHHEQQMLSNEMFTRKRPYENDQPPHNFEYAPHHSSTQNFAHLYEDDPGSSYNFGPPQQIKKRHMINVWEDDRFNMNQNNAGPRFRPFAGPNPQRMSPPKPLMSITPSIGRRIAGPVPQRNRKDFIPNKVTKPKVKPYNVNKPRSAAPIPVNKKVVPPLPNKNLGGQMLLPDQVPSQQVAGRLELALGAILKEMKETYCTTEDTTNLFSSKHIQRSIKQSIRERLRAVMLNKVVGRFVEIVDIYRKTYPASTDKEIMDTAIFNTDSEHLIPPYFNKVLAKKLKDIFTRLQLLNEGKDAEVLKIIESRPVLSEETAEESKKRHANAKAFYASLVDAMLEDRIPKLLPNYTEQIIKLFEQSKENKSDDKDNKDLEKNEEDTSINEEETSMNLDSEVECKTENPQVTDTDTEKLNNVVKKEENLTEKGNNVVEKEEKLTTNLSDEIINIEKSQINENIKEVVENEESEEKEVEVKSEEVADDSKADISIGTPVLQTKSCATSKYFVKVLGQPSLPNRVDAYKFLNKFNAVSIKKHKVIQNLLVVGFNNEKDFNDALSASGSNIGTSNLIIKANDKPSQSNSSPSPKENKNDKEILPIDLENQISDLLSSIRKADEDDKDDITMTEETNKTDGSAELDKTDDFKKEIKQEGDAVLDNSEQPNSLNSTQNIKDTDNTLKEKSETVDNSDSKNILYSPSAPSDEDHQGLETIKEDDDGKGSIDSSDNTTIQSNGDKSVKSNRGRETPSKISRPSVATPRTLRTRSSSRLMPNN